MISSSLITQIMNERPLDKHSRLVRGEKLLSLGMTLYTVVVILAVTLSLAYTEDIGVMKGIHGGLCLLSAPWMAQRGFIWSRIGAEVIALVGAVSAIWLVVTLTGSEVLLLKLAASALFLPMCFLAYVFLFNKDVRLYVASIPLD